MTFNRFVQNSVEVDHQFILLKNGDVYYTHTPQEALLVSTGSVRVFIIPWNQTSRRNYRALLGVHNQGKTQLIPAFAHTDAERESWCFAIVSSADDTVLERHFCPESELQNYMESATGQSQNHEDIVDTIISLYVNADAVHDKLHDKIKGSSESHSHIMTLEIGQFYYTADNDDSWYVEKGRANIYVVPIDENGQTAKRQFLRTADDQDGSVIPGYRKQSGDFTYCLGISPTNDSVLLRKTKCTRMGRERFLEGTKAQDYANEGFDSAVVQFYKKHNEIAILVKYYELKANLMEINRKIKKAITHGLGKKTYKAVSENSSTLYYAMHYICSEAKIKLLSEDDLKRLNAKDDMLPTDIARVSNFICREVVLEDHWWHHDCGMLLCYKDSKPIACVPLSGGQYRFFDPETGKEEKLSDLKARSLGPKAYSIRRNLPLATVNRKDLFAFVRKSILLRDVCSLILIGVLCIAVSLLLPYINQKIYDEYIPTGEAGMVVQICLVAGTFMLGNTIFNLVKRLYEFRISTKAGYELQDAIFCRVFQMSESFLRRFDSGDLSQRVQSFGTLANKLVKKLVVTGISSLFALLYIFQMVHYAKRLTLVSIILLCVYAAVIYLVSSAGTRYEKIKAESANEAMGKLHQYLDGVQKIRMAGAENHVVADYLKSAAVTQRASVLSNRISSVSDVFRDAGFTLFSMVLYYMIVHDKLQLSTGNFIAFNTAFGSLCAAAMELVNELIEYSYLKPSIALAKPILADIPEIGEKDMSSKVEQLTGEVSLEQVSFSYSASSGMVLRNLNIRIAPGEYVGIVGPSGCGKSTLLKLLLGFEKPTTGSVEYGGSDLTSMNIRSLRKQLGVVLQNGSLIAGSIYENVTITMDNPTRKAAEEAIEKVGLKEDIDSMPMHMETVISESAGTISGGQKQRILIARAIAGEPRILLFDEATSALDNITQAKVSDSLNRMKITRIVIAHRLSTIEHCDRILVMDRGSIIQEGTFSELISQEGMFQRMAARQIVEFGEE